MTDWKQEQLKVATGVTDGSRNPEYERGFIDGMQEQMRRSVDKAVNAMAKREWVGLTDEEIAEFDVDPVEAKALIQKLKEKNT